MDKLLRREVVLTVICSIICMAFVLELAICVVDGRGGIPEEEAEDEKIEQH